MDDRTDARKPTAHNAAAHSKQDRLRQALRENLKRRKSQARGRNEVAAGSQESATQDGSDADQTDDGTERSR
jgi:hypothetical protein